MLTKILSFSAGLRQLTFYVKRETKNQVFRNSSTCINRKSREEVMRINKMITKGKMPSYFINLTISTNSQRKCMEISPENSYLDINGA